VWIGGGSKEATQQEKPLVGKYFLCSS